MQIGGAVVPMSVLGEIKPYSLLPSHTNTNLFLKYFLIKSLLLIKSKNFIPFSSRKTNFIKGSALNPSAASGLGFTLIELLVVIAVVAFLSTITFALLSNAREKARDSRRLSDINNIEEALSLYYDSNGQYPPHNAVRTCNVAGGCGPGGGDIWDDLGTSLAAYFTTIPIDPSGLQNNYRYHYDADSSNNYQTYGLSTELESSSGNSLMIGDGGFFDGRYEIGDQPKYCMLTYDIPPGDPVPADASWNGGGAVNICNGGS